MQALCGLQGVFDLFNCKTPAPIMPIHLIFSSPVSRLSPDVVFCDIAVRFFFVVPVRPADRRIRLYCNCSAIRPDGYTSLYQSFSLYGNFFSLLL